MTAQTIFTEGGVTLLPVSDTVTASMKAMEDYLDALWKELKSKNKAEYKSQRYETLKSVFGIALYGSDPGCYSCSDLRALLTLNVQFVDIYKAVLGKRMPDPDDGFPYDIISVYFEFLLFVAELTQSGLNLLSKKRRSMEAIFATYQAETKPPDDSISTIGWRKHLRSDKEFQDQCKVASTYFGKKRWAYWLNRWNQRGDWLIEFCGNPPYKIEEANLDTDEYQWLKDFCFKYRLEMLGTFLSDDLDTYGLHFMPQRIHYNRSDSGTSIMIPNFYSFNQFRALIDDGSLEDLEKLISGHGSKINKKQSLFEGNEIKTVNRMVKQALKKSGCSKQQADEIGAVVAGAIEHSGAHGAIGDGERKHWSEVIVTKNEKDKIAQKTAAVTRAHKAVLAHTSDPKLLRLWAEYRRQGMYLGEYDPFSDPS